MSSPEDSAADRPVLPMQRRRPRDLRTIETVLLASTACLLAAVAWPIATRGLADQDATPSAIEPPTAVERDSEPLAAAPEPTIQIALLLDTSSSMEGLLHQARTRLWTVVNSLDSATFHDKRPRIEVALYEYGNDRLPGEQGYIRRVTGFTSELDRVSEALFGLSTMGGSEFAAQAIDRATDELQWRDGPGVMRVMYVAGNESFDQGNVPWAAAIDDARAHGIVVNTVLCASPDGYDAALWRSAAERAGGRFFSIDQDRVQAYVATPYDEELGKLGTAINKNYVGYGNEGLRGVANQVEQDENNMADGEGRIQRSISKSSAHYSNPSWDLVDAVTSKAVELDGIEQEALPESLRGMAPAELEAYVAARRAERDAIAARVAELRNERERWLGEHSDAGSDTGGLDRAMIGAITEQARTLGFTLGES